jgi:NADH:ubiquinone oxidoreductase subunit 2 (subunit N)
MLNAHHVLAFLVLAACAVTAVWGFVAYRRGREAGRTLAHLIALVQTLLVAQVALGLLLLSDHRRASDHLHYAYGTLALCAVLAPWFYAPAGPRRRLLWFAGATLVAGALGVRAYLTAG